ncbi:MAG: ATP-binding protein [Janthinobacterium lividum]
MNLFENKYQMDKIITAPKITTNVQLSPGEVQQAKSLFLEAKRLLETMNVDNFKSILTRCDAIVENFEIKLIDWLRAYNNQLDPNQMAIYTKYCDLKLTLAGTKRLMNNDRLVINSLLEASNRNISFYKSSKVPEYLRLALGEGSDEKNVLSLYSQKPLTTFQDIIGMEREKSIIEIQNHDLFKLLSPQKSYRRLILYGPPGTGKTDFAEAIANQLSAQFVVLTPNVLLDPTIGVSEKKLNDILVSSQTSQTPVVLLFDEMDNVFRRDASSNELNESITVLFLSKVNENLNDNLFIIGTTNYPNRVDPAVVSRLNNLIEVGLPSKENLAQLFNKILPYADKNQVEIEFNKSPYQDILYNFSNRDMITLAKNIQRLQIEEIVRNYYFISNVGRNFYGEMVNGFQIYNITNNAIELNEEIYSQITTGNLPPGNVYLISDLQKKELANYMIPLSPLTYMKLAASTIIPISDEKLLNHKFN